MERETQSGADAASIRMQEALAFFQRSVAKVDDGAYPEDLVQFWEEDEVSYGFTQDLGKGCLEPALDRDVRRAAVGCVEHTMRLMGVQASSFGQAVVAIDIFCRQTAQAEKLHLLVRLPSACAAICSIICKMNGLQANRPIQRRLLPGIEVGLGQWLQAQGVCRQDDLICVSEQDVLKALGWNIHRIHAAEQWLACFSERLGDATMGFYRHQLAWVTECGSHVVRLLLQEASSFEISPRQLAAGVFAHALAQMKLLPSREFAPALSGSASKGGSEAPESATPAISAKYLELAIRCDVEKLREAAAATSLLMARSPTGLAPMSAGPSQEAEKGMAATTLVAA